jgi:acyl carrier protein
MSMNDQSIDDRLREVAAAVLGVDTDVLSEASSPENLGAWTSIRHLALIAAVEEAFAIQFSLTEIHKAQKFGELRQLVAERLAPRARRG